MARSGDQIDRNVNLSVVGNGAGGQPLPQVGPASPSYLAAQSTFWAHGVRFGIGANF